MGYVKHDLAKAIRTVLNSASGGFREQAADLKRVSDPIDVAESDVAESTRSSVLLFRKRKISWLMCESVVFLSFCALDGTSFLLDCLLGRFF